MRPITLALWGALAVLTLLWLVAEPGLLQIAAFIPLRNLMIQYSGVLAIGAMSIAMILALRPRWPEAWLGGLDKMYRLHKWLGIAALIVAVIHWLWTQAPGWLVSLGLLERGQRPPRPPIENPIERFLANLRGPAEGLGEWAFCGAVVLIILALIPRFPYRWFFKTHRLLAIAYLVLAFHTIVLMEFSYWTTPLGLAMAVLVAYGVVASVIVLLRQVGAGRKVDGTIANLHYYPSLRVLEGEVDLAPGWPGHKAGQFAFVTSDTSEGAHPFTIASAWNAAEPRLLFIAKELGDFTSKLRETVKPGQKVKVEGPYGQFTFEDDCSHQIWVGGGIGITPFIGRMKQLAEEQHSAQIIDLFHTTTDWSEEAIGKLKGDAAAANVRLHILHDARDGLLTGERIRAEVPEWREASLWFCGPTGFGEALKGDFKAQGLPVSQRFHQELFAMR